MTASTVLATLALRLSEHPENIATEALLHVLRSPIACAEMSRIIREIAPMVPPPTHYRSQAVQDDAIPDLLGLANGTEVVVIENKFWAGLTDAQPCSYLQRLESRPSLVLVIAPSARLNVIWPELVHRCKTRDLSLRPQEERNELRATGVGSQQTLALMSWRAVLGRLAVAAREAQDQQLAGDIEQLQGLCDAMDTEAFLPLRGEELGEDLARRIVQFNTLVDSLAGTLVERGVASKKGLRATGSRGWYGHYLSIHGYGVQISFNAYHWMSHGASPLWIRIADDRWEADHRITDYLRNALPETMVLHSDEAHGTLVPLYLRTGLELDEVSRSALAQLEHLAVLLEARGRSSDVAPAPKDEMP